jgi:hypothetical protein
METVNQRSMWIAPSRYKQKRYWTVDDWKTLNFTTEDDWKTAIEIFEDRINYRYLNAIQTLQDQDNHNYANYAQRCFGFPMMGLACLLIETLAQFMKALGKVHGDKTEIFMLLSLQKNRFVLRNISTLKPKLSFFTTLSDAGSYIKPIPKTTPQFGFLMNLSQTRSLNLQLMAED